MEGQRPAGVAEGSKRLCVEMVPDGHAIVELGACCKAKQQGRRDDGALFFR